MYRNEPAVAKDHGNDEQLNQYYQYKEAMLAKQNKGMAGRNDPNPPLYARPSNSQNPLEDEEDEYNANALESSFNSSAQDMGEKRRKQLNDLVLSLENELTEQLYSHKIFLEDINRIEEERNFYYDRLRQIEEFVQKD
mmetsp:Transcript_33246/g.38174  ORF Transcript_33246/g.38174 Transcript_33246/m.38174 type:complete len:138 (+) Transcript_33246:452-865(+)